jgi:hypothetical protein
MNEPKRRGRPTNAEIAAREAAPLAPVAEAMADKALSILAQTYALRVWNGQSPDVKREEKIRRVKLALEGQNLPFDGVQLP